MYKLVFWVFFMLGFFSALRFVQAATPSGKCQELKLKEIPVGRFDLDIAAPMVSAKETQKYNTSHGEGFYYQGQYLYGHAGWDLAANASDGVRPAISSVVKGKVILSYADTYAGGWGESVIVATRPSKYSEEIVTFHYHHLHNSWNQGVYWTSRQVEACDEIAKGGKIGEQGSTGVSTNDHLHLGVRRWKSIDELNNAIKTGGYALFGYGYTSGQNKLLEKNLDPKGIVNDTFTDLDGDKKLVEYEWAYNSCHNMRNIGITFGLFDGTFGVDKPVTRAQAAKWIKIAYGAESVKPDNASFLDVEKDKWIFPYVETMGVYPPKPSAINKMHSCKEGGLYYCPDKQINRAEALKMVVTAFYPADFIKVFNDNFWLGTVTHAVSLVTDFEDVNPSDDWFAPYVYFGVIRGFVAKKDHFYPEREITRAEFAKWITYGYAHKFGSNYEQCRNVQCDNDAFCFGPDKSCVTIGECLTNEEQLCAVGGGTDLGEYEDPYVSPEPTVPPDVEPSVEPEPVADEPDPVEPTPAPVVECECDRGKCCDGCNYRDEGYACNQDYVYRCEGTQAGDNAQKARLTTFCSGRNNDCDGTTEQSVWQKTSDCSKHQTCEMQNGDPVCIGNCDDEYLASAQKSCKTNSHAEGEPELCLYVYQINDQKWTYKVCKEGGLFKEKIKYSLRDNNYNVFFDEYSNPVEKRCTDWEEFRIAYVENYGVSNAAGLQAVIKSPSTCSNSLCTYKTGTISIRKECN
ncbi:peptidoglycan DD-metalloendopeptidase family protein [Candidatus Peregrinibacteria bacterium]|nr:peptidoglycan DD-metalloendopeptidase family protein [Candidatus Peregrinibacteria bacterium]